jgi:hypothetical protein
METDIEYSYKKIAELGSLTSKYLLLLVNSYDKYPERSLEIFSTTTIQDISKKVETIPDLCNLKNRILRLLIDLDIDLIESTFFEYTKEFSELSYKIGELILVKYNKESALLYGAFSNFQTFIYTYNNLGVIDTILKRIHDSIASLEAPSYFFNVLSNKSWQHNDDPKPSQYFLNWFYEYRQTFLDYLIGRKFSSHRNLDDFESFYTKILDYEDRFTKEILVPLLHCLCTSNITYNHSKDEFGRDLVWSYQDPFGQNRFCGAQVKSFEISGAANNTLDKLISQIDDAFKMPFNLSGESVFISEFYVITSKRFTKNAIEKMKASLN